MPELPPELARRATPEKAWLLSLLYPGLGQFAVDAATRGLAVLLLFTASIAAIISFPDATLVGASRSRWRGTPT